MPLNVRYASRLINPSSLVNLLGQSQHVLQRDVACGLREELSTRLAHQIKRLGQLPISTGSIKPIQQLAHVHQGTFMELQEMELIVTKITGELPSATLLKLGSDPLGEFARCLTSIGDRHAGNLETLMDARLGMGVLGEPEERKVQGVLDDFLRVHIGFQLLCRHYLLCVKQATSRLPQKASGQVGMVSQQCVLSEVVADSAAEAQMVTERHHADAPDVIVEGALNATICCVPSHVHHVLFEVLKNSLEASFLDAQRSGGPPADVKVLLKEDQDRVQIHVVDRGGGMLPEAAQDAFRYTYTSSESYRDVELRDRENQSYQPSTSPLSGMGIGLPLSRLYARHFGGELSLVSKHGYGTEVVVALPRCPSIPEQIPLMW